MKQQHSIADDVLLVPVYLDALVVGDKVDTNGINLRTRYEEFRRGGKILGSDLAPMPRPSTDEPLEPGVHLHWMLPMALRHGVSHEGAEELEFPRAPNRWLVMRYSVDHPGDARYTAAWVVEGDYLDQDDASSPVLHTIGERVTRSRIGRAVPLSEWREDTQAERYPLTAIGPGDPAFAATYGGCRNVFGLHDPMSDATPGKYSYLVVGWYSDSANDPMSLAQGCPLYEALRPLWSWPGSEDEPAVRAQRTICHAALYGVDWSPGSSAMSPPNLEIKTAMGNTAIEAVSALLCEGAGAGSEVETLVSALAYDLLADPNESPAMADLEAEIHRRRFVPLPGGSVWELQKAERPLDLPGQSMTHTSAGAPHKSPDIPEVLAGELKQLNAAQQRLDALSRELAGLQWDYYFSWCLQNLSRPPEHVRKAAERLASTGPALAERIQNLQGQKLAGENNLAQRTMSIQSSTRDKAQWELIESEMPRFWGPTDPVLLLTGPGVGTPGAWEASQTEPLPCRLDKEVLTTMTFDTHGGVLHPHPQGPIALEAEGLLQQYGFAELLKLKGDLPAIVSALWGESLLLDPGLARPIAREANREAQSGLAEDAPAFGDLISAVKQAQTSGYECDAGPSLPPFNGRLPGGFGAREHAGENEWRPLFIAWEAEWSPTEADSAYAISRNLDYRCQQAASCKPEVYRYQGWTALTDDLPRQLSSRLKEVPWQLTARLRDRRILTQPLSGLTKAFIGRQQGLLLPPMNSDGDILGDVQALVEDTPDSSPRFDTPDAFYPLNSGMFTLTSVWLVDSFGRALAAVDHEAGRDVIGGIALSPAVGDLTGGVYLPPRLMQPARMRMCWVSNIDDTCEADVDPGVNPVCGWVVPDYLDKSLLIFDAHGRELDRFSLTHRGTALRRQVEPEVVATCNHHLLGFLDGLEQAGPAAMADLMGHIDRVSLCMRGAALEQHQALGLLIGQPLALVRAAIDLELGEPAARNPFAHNATTPDFTQYRFPVRLGDARLRKNGLIGWFQNNDYARLCVPYGLETSAGEGYLDAQGQLDLSLEDASRAITGLLDPRAGMHARAGILPMEYLPPPRTGIDAALEAMEFNFRVGPVLGHGELPTVPLPQQLAGQWSWCPPGGKASTLTQLEGKTTVTGSTDSAQILEGWLKISTTLDEVQQSKGGKEHE